MSPWLKHKESIQNSATELFESKIDEVVANAELDASESLKLEESETDGLAQLILDETDALEESIIDAAGEDQSGVSETTITTAKVATAYFIFTAVQRAMDRTHGAVIARQRDSDLAPEEGRKTIQEAVDSAVKIGKSEIEFVATNEVGTSYGEMVKEHHESLGDVAYVWNTSFNNSRQTHIDNHLKIFRFDSAPSTGHPGHEHNCQCWMERPQTELNQVENKRGINVQNFRSEVQGDTLKLKIHGVIVNDAWYEDEVAAIEIINEIQAYEGQSIELSIYSGGGDAFAGAAIKSALQQHSAKVTANVIGLAASAATTIAAGADHITIGETDTFLIHNAWTFAAGDKLAMRRISDDLDTLDKSIAFTWAKRSGIKQDDIHSLMNEDRYMTAQEALEKGLVNEIRDTSSAQNCVGGFCAPQSAISKMPADMVSKYRVTAAQSRIGQNPITPNIQKSKPSNSARAVEINDKEEAKVDLDELKAKLAIANKENGKLKNQVADLEQSQISDEQREKVRNEVRKELQAEQTELNNTLKVANDAGFEVDGSTADEVRRNVVKEAGAENSHEMSDESATNVFNLVIKNAKDALANEAADDVSEAFSGKQDADDLPTSIDKT